jgi:uncharacterized protein (TIGR03083 family)
VTVPDRGRAFRDERAALLKFCDSLGPADWRMNSRAQGWSVADVVAHLGSACHTIFSPAALAILRGTDIEQSNDDMVDRRRVNNPAQVLREYRRWSRVFATVMTPLSATPLGGVQLPLAELGRFPMRSLVSAMVFDTHTHLRYDIAPALNRPAPETDANRVAVVLEWMTAVLANQLGASRPAWLERPLSLTLAGPGGGTWRIEPDGSVTAGQAGPAAAQIAGVATEFPEWGTRRAGWRDRDVTIAGDIDYGTAFLDAMNIV